MRIIYTSNDSGIMDNDLKKVFTIWFTGLSGSGKTTLAHTLHEELGLNGIQTVIMDGDIIRKTVNKDLGFSMDDREENNRRVAEIAKIINNSGINVICSFISPTNKMRDEIRDIIGDGKLIIIYMKTSIETCESRDKKRLYQKARQGIVKNFTGITSAFEEPEAPDIIIDGNNSVDENIKHLKTVLNQKYEVNL